MSDCRLMAAAAATAVLAGCAAPEQSLLEQFFAASRLRDTTGLQRISTVIFEPREQGIVRAFRIAGVTPERQDGPKATKDVTVEASVNLADGQTVRQTLVVTMQRDSGPGSGRWLVTGFKVAGAFRPVPPS